MREKKSEFCLHHCDQIRATNGILDMPSTGVRGSGRLYVRLATRREEIEPKGATIRPRLKVLRVWPLTPHYLHLKPFLMPTCQMRPIQLQFQMNHLLLVIMMVMLTKSCQSCSKRESQDSSGATCTSRQTKLTIKFSMIGSSGSAINWSAMWWNYISSCYMKEQSYSKSLLTVCSFSVESGPITLFSSPNHMH